MFQKRLLAMLALAVFAANGNAAQTEKEMEMNNPLEKPGWELTFHDEFDRPRLDDMYWYSAYRSGRKEYFKRIGVKSRWVDPNAHYVFSDGILKLRIDRALPFRPTPQTPCVSCITTSDHRFGKTTADVRILDKFSQKYGWFEMRAKCPRGEGLMSAFWLHHVNPLNQEFAPDGTRRGLEAGSLEIDIFEQQGRNISDTESHVDLNTHFTKDGHYLHTIPADVSADFHIWAMEWEEGRIRWYFDNQLMETYTGPTPPEKMFLLIALFQYSGWIGEIDPKMVYPKDFEIDYVRVYRKISSASAEK